MILGGLAGITLGTAFIALLVWLRHVTPRSLRPVPAAQFYTVPDGTRWLVCHNAGICGRMQTPHVPAGGGLWRCTTPGCSHTTKGDDQ